MRIIGSLRVALGSRPNGQSRDIFGAWAHVGPGINVIATQGATMPSLSGGRDDGRDPAATAGPNGGL
jgi:hypothetical protein